MHFHNTVFIAPCDDPNECHCDASSTSFAISTLVEPLLTTASCPPLPVTLQLTTEIFALWLMIAATLQSVNRQLVIHELVHLLEKNHTHRFRALVEEYCPTWQEAKKLLSTMPLDYMEKGDTDIDDE